MRRLVVVGLLVVAACSGGQELATTSTSGEASRGPEVATTPPDPDSPDTTGPRVTLPPASTVPLSTDFTLSYEPVADLAFPIQLVARPGDPFSYVISKEGTMWALIGGEVGEEPVLDLAGLVSNGSEQGLLSIALHPTDEDRFYLHYSDSSGDTQVSEFRFTSPTSADPGSERSLLNVSQPARNHNGGMIMFNPLDGRLLVGLGDGGGSGDRFNHGQNTGSLLAGLVSLDVEGEPDPTLYAHGLRNPWRFWIDNSLLYIADVGQNAFEEISVAPLAPDQNFGWPITEGLHCFRPSSGCDPSGTVLPVLEVRQGDAGTCSITGGVVYRGFEIPELDGQFLYSDYCGGYLRSLLFNGGGEEPTITDWTGQVGVPGSVTSFGVDGAGEVYVLTNNTIFRLIVER